MKPASKRPLKPRLAKGRALVLRGLSVRITDDLLQGPNSDRVIAMIRNWEAETGSEVMGKLIVLG